MTEVENSTGRTLAFIFCSLSACLTGIFVNVYSGAICGLCFLICVPYTLSVGGFQGSVVESRDQRDEEGFSKSGATAEESLNAIKVVKAFGQENNEISRFNSHLQETQGKANHDAKVYGFAFGMMETIIYLCPAISFLIGGFFIAEEVSLELSILGN